MDAQLLMEPRGLGVPARLGQGDSEEVLPVQHAAAAAVRPRVPRLAGHRRRVPAEVVHRRGRCQDARGAPQSVVRHLLNQLFDLGRPIES